MNVINYFSLSLLATTLSVVTQSTEIVYLSGKDAANKLIRLYKKDKE